MFSPLSVRRRCVDDKNDFYVFPTPLDSDVSMTRMISMFSPLSVRQRCVDDIGMISMFFPLSVRQRCVDDENDFYVFPTPLDSDVSMTRMISMFSPLSVRQRCVDDIGMISMFFPLSVRQRCVDDKNDFCFPHSPLDSDVSIT